MKHLFFIYFSRAKEKHIADDTDFSRMINASSFEDAFKVLQDTDYAPYSLNKKPIEYEDAIEEEKKQFKEDFIRMGAEGEILEVLSIKQENILESLKKIKSKKTIDFLKAYEKLVVSFRENLKKGDLESAKKNEQEMGKIEKEFILKSEMEGEGLSPFFAFILKKKRAEKTVRLILSSKKVGISSDEINNLIPNIKAI